MKKLKWHSAVTSKIWFWQWMFWWPVAGLTQNISLLNPSFEAVPAMNALPASWHNVSVPETTFPDIQPGFWGVKMPPKEGNAYLGLVVREDNTAEGVGQRLSAPLQMGATYEFSVWLTRSSKFRSATPMSNGEERTFSAPTVLKIWGYNSNTKKEELLALSEPVGMDNWVKYVFTITPLEDDYDEIDLMVSSAPMHYFKNGNLLIDNCSDIVLKIK
jgi:hypothetical protein